MTLEDLVRKYYTEQNYNCAETMIHACNAYYHLYITEEDMRMLAGFGAGMFVGDTCGSIVGCIAALSKMTVQNKAHEELNTIRPLVQRYMVNFKEIAGATNCAELKPKYNITKEKCLPTCLLAAKALETTLDEQKEKAAV